MDEGLIVQTGEEKEDGCRRVGGKEGGAKEWVGGKIGKRGEGGSCTNLCFMRVPAEM